MHDAEDQWRLPPAEPYRPVGASLMVPEDALRATCGLLIAAGRNEACVFWYGLRDGSAARVLAVRAPEQSATRFNYHVSEAAMSRMSGTLADEWRPMAQVHSHPSHLVEHSRYDDAMVASRRALSLVFPHYGRLSSPWPVGVGVHEWQDGYWHLLDPTDAAARVRIVPAANVSVEDLR